MHVRIQIQHSIKHYMSVNRVSGRRKSEEQYNATNSSTGRIQNVFIVNQIKPLYYNMLLFTINVQRQIYYTNLYSRITGTLCLYSRTTGILCALAWGG